MPRLKTGERELILADFHTGLFTVRELAKKYDVSHTTVNKFTKGSTPKHKGKVDTILAIDKSLSRESFQEIGSVNFELNKRLDCLEIYRSSAVYTTKRRMKKLKNIADADLSFKELSQVSSGNAKDKEIVFGKQDSGSVNILNNIDDSKEINEIKISIDS